MDSFTGSQNSHYCDFLSLGFSWNFVHYELSPGVNAIKEIQS